MSSITPQSGSSFINLDGERGKPTLTTFRDDSMYLVDFTKLNSVQDLITVIAAMGISFHKSHPHFNTISNLLAIDNPIPINPTTHIENK